MKPVEVYAEVEKSRFINHWKKDYEMACSIDGDMVYLGENSYVFDYRNISKEELIIFFEKNNPNNYLIYLYSNFYYNEIEDFIDFLTSLPYKFILFMKGKNSNE